MKKEVELLLIVIFLFIVNLSYITALNNDTESIPSINFIYPDSINSGEEFNATLILHNFSADSYDIKIDFLTNMSETSKIWNNGNWQSTFNYVNDAINTSINNEGGFRLNITSIYNQSAEIIVKIRNSMDDIFTYDDYATQIIAGESRQPNNNQNNTNNDPLPNNTMDNPVKEDISLKLDWNSDDIKNGEEFDIEINAYNLEDKTYDVKVYINNDENKVISQVYYNDKWSSSSSYMNDFIIGPGDKSETAKLRINKNFMNFSGDASIGVRIREHGIKSYKKEYEDTIEILEADNLSIIKEVKNSTSINNSKKTANQNKISENVTPATGEVIYIRSLKDESESIKSKENTLYQSNNESIKKYSIYGFIVLIIIFLITIVLLNMIKKKKYIEE